jgi:hypothetical protein
MILQAALMAAKTEKGALAKAAKRADALLREMVAITLKPDLTRIQRTSLETCITVHMHQKEVTGQSQSELNGVFLLSLLWGKHGNEQQSKPLLLSSRVLFSSARVQRTGLLTCITVHLHQEEVCASEHFLILCPLFLGHLLCHGVRLVPLRQ